MKIKRSKAIIITAIAFVVIASILLTIGGYIAGWDIVGFFKSPMFLLVVFVGLWFILIMAFIFFKSE